MYKVNQSYLVSVASLSSPKFLKHQSIRDENFSFYYIVLYIKQKCNLRMKNKLQTDGGSLHDLVAKPISEHWHFFSQKMSCFFFFFWCVCTSVFSFPSCFVSVFFSLTFFFKVTWKPAVTAGDQRATTKACALCCAAVIFALLNTRNNKAIGNLRPLLMNTR